MHMVTYAVLGLGMMGEAIVHDLLSFDEVALVIGYELRDERREELVQKFTDRFTTQPLDLSSDDSSLRQSLKAAQVDLVFGAIDYKYNLQLTKLCIALGIHFLDLGGNPDIVHQQHECDREAKEAGVTVIPDLGLAPGMADIIASHTMQHFDKLEECHIRVGGLPQHPETILNYQQVFSIRGLTNEYLEEAIVIRNGKRMLVPSLTEVEVLEFPEPYGRLEAFQTAGGTSSLPDIYEGKINELSYKTIRYPGHCQFFRFLVDFGLLSSEPYPKNQVITPRELVEYYLETNLPRGNPDVVLVRITAKGEKAGVQVQTTKQLIDLEKDGYTAMARTTAFPISIVGQMIMNGVISERGVRPGELVVPEIEFETELARRNIRFTDN